MYDIATSTPVHQMALHAAVQAALSDVLIGVSTGSNNPTRIHLTTALAPELETTLDTILDAHDPVFLHSDKTAIAANGMELATITVSTPKPDAAPVTLLIDGTAVPVLMTNGVGTITIASSDPATIHVSVQNPANRTTDSLVVEAS